jgi:hypothetical protein
MPLKWCPGSIPAAWDASGGLSKGIEVKICPSSFRAKTPANSDVQSYGRQTIIHINGLQFSDPAVDRRLRAQNFARLRAAIGSVSPSDAAKR